MIVRIIRWVLLLSVSVQAFSQNTDVFHQKAYNHAAVSFRVLEVNSAKILTQFQPSLGVTPASVLKLVTTAAALEMLGPDYRFQTKLMYSGYIRDGVLDGDLWIVGGGDPSLGSKQVPGEPLAFLSEWSEAVRTVGITRIKGRIVADAGMYDDEGVSPYWLWEDLGNYYATGIYGLNVFDNSFRLELKSGAVGSRPEIVALNPQIPGLTVENHLTAASNTIDSAYLYGAPFQNEMRLFGTIPANRESFVIRGQIPDPPTYLAGLFAEKLKQNGISIDGEALSTRSKPGFETPGPVSKTELHTTWSPPLIQLIRIIHEKSDNFYAECLLRQLAVIEGSSPATAREGIQIVRDFWKRAGLDVAALSMYDASGLSPNNRVSADFLAELLRYMATKSKNGIQFEASLPLAGKEGTVSGFLRGTDLEGKLRLKSGSNQVVNSYAGYYRKNGRFLVVVIIVDHADADRFKIRKDMENILLSL
jgi:serine-type D-Ala-D-Ala carboxypeptidase/endopeptidase (penicillin-binding protein 4)